MDFLRQALRQFKAGELSEEDVLARFRDLSYESLGYATLDHHRALRKGYPEVIFCANKTVEQVVEIARHIAEKGQGLLGTRASNAMLSAVREVLPQVRVNEAARAFWLPARDAKEPLPGNVLVVSAGTSDLPVAEEAVVTLQAMNHRVDRLVDVGVAGIHRLLLHKDKIDAADVLIVIAGMEGALASVIGGLVDKPLIAVPTSVGYGASFNGLAALLGMLNSCVSGVTVVNIDNGFGAAYAAALILRTAAKLGQGNKGQGE